jgi:mannose-6-phosphate isomerase
LSERDPRRLTPSWREKIWGSTDLSPLFPPADRRIGEIWYTAPDFPLLTKFLFTSEKLSVQVHPDDAYAREHEGGRGKTEMWYVVRADPGAAVALGLTEPLPPDRLRQVALSGEIARCLNWVEVHPGDAIFLPAGTVHTIGPGLALCEIQQHSDLTYRFFDYGRSRPLHIEQAVAVARMERHHGPQEPEPFSHGGVDGETLVRCQYFTVDRLRVRTVVSYAPDAPGAQVLILLEGRGKLGGESYQRGDVFLVTSPLQWRPEEPTLALRTYE